MKPLSFKLSTSDGNGDETTTKYYFTLTPEGYTLSQFGEKEAKCVVAVSYLDDIDSEPAILGSPFLRAFDASFDATDNRIMLSLANDALG